MSHSAEATTTKTETTGEIAEFETQLHQSNALHTNGEWVSGRLTNIRIRPVLRVYGRAFDTTEKSYSINPTEHTVNELSKSNRFVTTTDEPPFFDFDDRSIPYSKMRLDSIDKDTAIVESLEDLCVCDDSKDTVTLVPTDGDGEYLICTVRFELLGTVNSGEILQPHTVSLQEERSLDSFKTQSYHNELLSEDDLNIKYKYESNTLSLRYHPSKSKNWITPRRFTQLYTITFIAGIIYFWTKTTTAIESMFSISGTLSDIVIFGIISYVIYKGMKRVFPYVKSKTTTGSTRQNVEATEWTEPSVFNYSRTHSIKKENDRIREKAEQLSEELKKLPREVTVQPARDGTKLVAKEKNISWKLTDGAVIDEESLQFFVEYGFEDDMKEIETHMVKREEVVPNHLPALKSTNGRWYLLPERIEVDPVITID